MLSYLLIQVAVISILHDDTKVLILVEKCLFVRYYVGMLDGREYSNLIESILSLTGIQRLHANLLQCVDNVIVVPFDFVNLTVGALTYAV